VKVPHEAVPPTTVTELHDRGWDAVDIALVSGDAYVDHPSFGAAVIGRVLEAAGFRVGIIPQPDWHSAEPFRALGAPRLCFGVTSGNMDSMVNHYTAHRRGVARTPIPWRAGRTAARSCGPGLLPALPGGLQERPHRAWRRGGFPEATGAL